MTHLNKVAAVVITALVLAGCGSSSTDKGNTSPASTFGPPAGFQALRGATEDLISWDAADGAASYNLYLENEGGAGRGELTGATFLGSTTFTTFTVIHNGVVQNYFITSVDGDGNESSPSPPAFTAPGSIIIHVGRNYIEGGALAGACGVSDIYVPNNVFFNPDGEAFDADSVGLELIEGGAEWTLALIKPEYALIRLFGAKHMKPGDYFFFARVGHHWWQGVYTYRKGSCAALLTNLNPVNDIAIPEGTSTTAYATIDNLDRQGWSDADILSRFTFTRIINNAAYSNIALTVNQTMNRIEMAFTASLTQAIRTDTIQLDWAPTGQSVTFTFTSLPPL